MTTTNPASAALNLGALPVVKDQAGIPSLLTATKDSPRLQGATATAIAKAHLARLSPAWGVTAKQQPTLELLGEVKLKGMTIVRLRQVIDGIPVARQSGGELHVAVKSDGSLIAASGRMFSTALAHRAPRFVDDETGAVARSVGNLYKVNLAPSAFSKKSTAAGFTDVSGGAGNINVSRSRTQKVWFVAPDGKSMKAAWQVDAYSSAGGTSGDGYRTIIGADGTELARHNFKSDVLRPEFKYRVFAETTGEFHPFDGPIVDGTPSATGVPNPAPFPNTPFPAFVQPNLVSVVGTNHPEDTGKPDPWMEDGFTETRGNNVDAYADFNDPDGLTFGDYRAITTAENTFDYTYDFTKAAGATQAQRMAGITSLFYTVNWMHDFWYDGGFTEAAGNAQDSNLGRGGIEQDRLLVEAQDASGTNNANMSTPDDGLSPRMQIFVWDNKDTARTLVMGALHPVTNSAAFGPQTFDKTAATVLANDATAPATDACTAITGATGKIVIVDRGACSFKTKAKNVQDAGGVGMILANNAAGAPLKLAEDATVTAEITIGSLSVSQADGVALKAIVGQSATLHREGGPVLDGTLDASVVAHEFGHYVHHRLSVCNTSLCGAMSEGWADFSAMLVVARDGDNLDGAYPMGIFSTRGFLDDPTYFGIRRAPYSTTPAINGWTYENMSQGVAIPTTFPTSGANPASNNEVHSAGEVWTSMLWDGYVALQKNRADDETFDDIRLKMRQYVVAGLLLAPPDGTPTEIVDALLLAVHGMSETDDLVLAEAYAKRGFGTCAQSPSRGSVSFAGIQNGLTVSGRTDGGAPSLLRLKSCDKDNVLDGGEGAQITVVVSNPGPKKVTGVTATLHTALPGVHIQTATRNIGDIDAYSKANAIYRIDLDESFTAPTASDLTVEITSADGCGEVDVPVDILINADDQEKASANDNFDASGSVWEASHDERLSGDGELWFHERNTALDGLWFGEESGSVSDARLSTPELTGTSHVTMTFEHTFLFEFNPNNGRAFDGGVIEVTTDGGETWQDVTELGADPGYNLTIFGDESTTDNPLAGRDAYGDANESFAMNMPDTVSLDFGDKLDGKTFQIRLRIGTDSGGGGGGWIVDNVAFTGIEGTPFPTLIADGTACAKEDDGKKDDGGCSAGHGAGAANAGLGLLALALVARRRRSRKAA